jgi:uncharacterized protein (TIGR00251 family)
MSDNRQWCTQLPTGVRLAVQITPNAKKNAVLGVHDNALKIKLRAQPVEGKANEALLRFISDQLDLPLRAVSIVQGQLNRHKLLEVTSAGLTVEAVRRVFTDNPAD